MDTKKYKVIGIMSGTSLDGVDVLACEFWQTEDGWKYELFQGETFQYSTNMLHRLKSSQNLNGLELAQLNVDYGKYLGELVESFIKKNNYNPDFIASHGYTVFHKPSQGLTLQIGSGAQIASITGVKTICDFRTNDVAMGGQGAPLVPIGDQLLFSEYAACLNLGGFSNISYESKEGSRQAFDICPVNYVLNYYSQKLGFEFDTNGELGRAGNVIESLLNELNDINYYSLDGPKSLGREFVEKEIFPIIPDDLNYKDVIATFYEHIVHQLSLVLNKMQKGKVLITGGGALNTYLIELLKQKCSSDLIVSEKELIEFKEALIFAFLGVLRMLEIPNCLASVTGAKKDNVGGCIYE